MNRPSLWQRLQRPVYVPSPLRQIAGALWRGLRWALLPAGVLAGSMLVVGLLPALMTLKLLLVVGAGQMAVVLTTWPLRATRGPSWHPGYEFPPRRGATLISAVIALALAAMCLAMALSVYLGGSRARIAQTHRLAALAVCQSQLETLRAGGFSALPSAERSFTSPDDPALRGTLSVALGTSGTRLVTATAGWPPEDRAPAGQVTLTALFAPRGVSP